MCTKRKRNTWSNRKRQYTTKYQEYISPLYVHGASLRKVLRRTVLLYWVVINHNTTNTHNYDSRNASSDGAIASCWSARMTWILVDERSWLVAAQVNRSYDIYTPPDKKKFHWKLIVRAMWPGRKCHSVSRPSATIHVLGGTQAFKISRRNFLKWPQPQTD